MVSIGEKPDDMVATMVNPSIFCGEGNAKAIKVGTQIRKVLPKQLPDETTAQVLDAAGESFKGATTTALVVQIAITLVVSASLKSMWNLMNVIQVLCYLRFFALWSGQVDLVMKYMDDAITLKPVSDPVINFGMDSFA